jgi:hypothetical protein
MGDCSTALPLSKVEINNTSTHDRLIELIMAWSFLRYNSHKTNDNHITIVSPSLPMIACQISWNNPKIGASGTKK